jgi:hypothetical protein
MLSALLSALHQTLLSALHQTLLSALHPCTRGVHTAGRWPDTDHCCLPAPRSAGPTPPRPSSATGRAGKQRIEPCGHRHPALPSLAQGHPLLEALVNSISARNFLPHHPPIRPLRITNVVIIDVVITSDPPSTQQRWYPTRSAPPHGQLALLRLVAPPSACSLPHDAPWVTLPPSLSSPLPPPRARAAAAALIPSHSLT